MTCAPVRTASWTAKTPTPPPAPAITTASPATGATALRPSVPLAQGRHSFQVSVTDPAGLTSTGRSMSMFVDSLPPAATITLTGQAYAGARLKLHLVYTDSSGVKHSLWYHTAKNLYYVITNFKQILEKVPQFGHSHLQIAVWYRATWEPGDVWPMLTKVLPN